MTTHFTHRGRRYRLVTRAETPGASWYLEYQTRGRRFRQSLETPVKSLAVEKAKLVLAAAEAGNLELARAAIGGRAPRATSTVADVVAWSERTILGCSEATRERYVNCLRLVLRGTVGEGYATRTLAEVLTPATVRAWTRASQAKAAAQPDQESSNRVLRSANSILRQAIALFAPRYCGHMRDAGLVLPSLDEFRAEVSMQRFRDVRKREWRPPTEEVIARTIEAWRASATKDRNLYLAVWLMLSCGLRIGEVAQARWGWVQPALLLGSARVKNRTGQIRLTPLEPYWSEGRATTAAWADSAPAAEDLILTGTDTERREAVFRRISAMLRGCGWESQKTNHALRALCGCWATRERGIYGAQQLLRHSSVLITETAYQWVLQ